ncbi:MAG: hypothetical protein ABWK01_06885 [Infirmifilum sp.]
MSVNQLPHRKGSPGVAYLCLSGDVRDAYSLTQALREAEAAVHAAVYINVKESIEKPTSTCGIMS